MRKTETSYGGRDTQVLCLKYSSPGTSPSSAKTQPATRTTDLLRFHGSGVYWGQLEISLFPFMFDNKTNLWLIGFCIYKTCFGCLFCISMNIIHKHNCKRDFASLGLWSCGRCGWDGVEQEAPPIRTHGYCSVSGWGCECVKFLLQWTSPQVPHHPPQWLTNKRFPGESWSLNGDTIRRAWECDVTNGMILVNLWLTEAGLGLVEERWSLGRGRGIWGVRVGVCPSLLICFSLPSSLLIAVSGQLCSSLPPVSPCLAYHRPRRKGTRLL